MKFRFCGELDCPDWVLAEIATLSKLTSIKMKMLCNQVTNSLLGSEIDFNKIGRITIDAKYEIGDIKASIAALAYIFMSATKHSVEGETLDSELQQLGLPKELSSAVCRVLSENISLLQAKSKSESLKLTTFEDLAWRIDFLISSNFINSISESSVILSFKLKTCLLENQRSYCFSITSDKATVLLHELKELHKKMEETYSG